MTQKVLTQVGATTALQLLRDMVDGKLDPIALQEAAKSSKKKARKLRQVTFLFNFMREQGLEKLVGFLKEHEGETIYLLEGGGIAIKQLVPQLRRR